LSLERRALLKGALGAAAGAATAHASSASVAGAEPLSLKRGMNLWPWFSLTREFPAPRTDYDWPPFQVGRPVPTRADLARLKSLGIDFVRLPLDPGPFLAATASQAETLLGDVVAAVRLALAQGLAVVVNPHINGANHHWNHGRLLMSAGAPGFALYRTLVVELAVRLQRLETARLALEPVNEPTHACGARDWDAMQENLLSAARSAAPSLTLVATGACGSMIAGLEPLKAGPLKRFAPLLYTFHFYEPYLFSHQGAPWMTEPVYRALNNVPWPASAGSLQATLASVRARMAADRGRSEAEKRVAYAETERVLKVYFDAAPDRWFIDKYLTMVRRWAEREGVPAKHIMMGEFGALRTDARYQAASAADRVRYIADVRSSAEALGFSWAFWNLFDGMGMMDDATRALDEDVARALGLAVP
jgi:hypothetical protein